MPATSQRRPRSHTASALTLAGLLLAVSHPALAQSFIGRGTPRILAVPDAERAGRPTPAGRAEAEPVSPPAAPPLRPFPALSSSLRLSGEESDLQWPVYLTEAQSREHLRLRIGYLAAISVVPDASFLTAKVNGVAVGRSEIKAPGAIRIIEFDIPGDLLKPGYNALEIAGVQRHRVDCSLDATYELWTQIDRPGPVSSRSPAPRRPTPCVICPPSRRMRAASSRSGSSCATVRASPPSSA